MVYDVAVIGGGPAGAMAAWSAAKNGADVVLLDDRVQIEGSVPECAEGVGTAVLDTLGLPQIDEWIENRCHKILIVAPSGRRRVLPLKSMEALILNRPKFEKWLIGQAEKAGAKYLPGCRALKTSRRVLWDEYSPVTDIKTSIYDSRKAWNIDAVAARIIIDCSGISGLFWKSLNPSPVPRLEKSDIGVCAQYRCYEPVDTDTMELWFGNIGHAPRGYSWIFPKKNYSNVGMGIQGGQNIDVQKNLRYFVLDRFGSLDKIADPTTSCLPLAPPLSTCSTLDGAMVAGDAARFCMATTGAGIGMSLYSGSRAGRWASEATKGCDCCHSKGDWWDMSISGYQREMARTIIPKLERAYELKRSFAKDDRSMERYLKVLLPLLWLHKIAPRFVEKKAAKNMRFA